MSTEKLIKVVLKDCHKELVSDLSLEAVERLWEEGFITDPDRENINSERTERLKRSQFIDTLMTKDDSALDALMRFLEEDGTQNHLVASLKKSKEGFESSSQGRHSNSKSGISVWFSEEPEKFSGKTKELTLLHENLTGERTTVITQNRIGSISGLGGIGKSSLARAYGYKYFGEGYYSSVVWIDAENPQSVGSSLKSLSQQEKLNVEKLEDLFKYFSSTRKPWLLILDNVEDSEFLQSLPKRLPPGTNKPHVLITSRAAIWPAGVEVLELELLRPEEAEKFIMAYDVGSIMSKKTTPESRQNLAKTLQFLPLAIKQAVAYITKIVASDSIQDPIENYLKLYNSEKRELELLEYAFSPTEKTVFKTWSVTLNKIRDLPNGPIAIEIMEICAYLNPERIGTNMFHFLATEAEEVARSVRLLKDYTMVTGEPEKINVHRLVQNVVRLNVKSNKEGVVNVLKSAFRCTYTDRNSLEANHETVVGHIIESDGLFQDSELISEIIFSCKYIHQYSVFSSAISSFKSKSKEDPLPLPTRCMQRFTEVLGDLHEDTLKLHIIVHRAPIHWNPEELVKDYDEFVRRFGVFHLKTLLIVDAIKRKLNYSAFPNEANPLLYVISSQLGCLYPEKKHLFANLNLETWKGRVLEAFPFLPSMKHLQPISNYFRLIDTLHFACRLQVELPAAEQIKIYLTAARIMQATVARIGSENLHVYSVLSTLSELLMSTQCIQLTKRNVSPVDASDSELVRVLWSILKTIEESKAGQERFFKIMKQEFEQFASRFKNSFNDNNQ